MKDPGFIKDAKTRNLEVAPISGAKIETLMASIYSAPADPVQAAKEATEKATKIKITKAVIPVVNVDGGTVKDRE